MERPPTSVVTPARTTGSSVISHTDDAADDIRQQLITELFMQHGCYPSCTSSCIIFFKYTCVK